MSNAASVMQMEGTADLERALKKLGREVRGTLAEKALTEGAKPIEDAARSKAAGISQRGARSISTAVKRKARGGFEAKVGPNADQTASRRDTFFMRFFELGTGPRFTKSGAYRGEIIQRPFLRPAFDLHKAEAQERIRRLLWEGIEREAGR